MRWRGGSASPSSPSARSSESRRCGACAGGPRPCAWPAAIADRVDGSRATVARATLAGMSPFRPDLVDCWMFRVGRTARDIARPEVLLMRRSPGRILPGLWQCVSGTLDPGERVALGALRELAEETGFGPPDIEAFYDLDLVNQFHEPSVDRVVTA